MKRLAFVGFILFAGIVSLIARADSRSRPCINCGDGENFFGGQHMMGYGIWSGIGLWQMFVPLIFWVLVIGGFILLLRYALKDKKGSSSAGGSGDSAMETLRMRFAKGEITKDEFAIMKKELAKK